MSKEAMQMALEALEQLQGGCTDHDDGTVEAITVWCPEVIDALREALAQPAQQQLSDEQILAANYPDGEENGPTIAAPDFEIVAFARDIESAIASQKGNTMSKEIKLPPLPEPHDGPNYHTDGIALFTDDQMQAYATQAVDAALAERQGEADPFTYIIQHLNSNPYALTKDECIQRVKELRTAYMSFSAPAQQPPTKVEEPVFTPATMEAIYAAWYETGVDIAGGNWERFVRAIEAAAKIGGEK